MKRAVVKNRNSRERRGGINMLRLFRIYEDLQETDGASLIDHHILSLLQRKTSDFHTNENQNFETGR